MPHFTGRLLTLIKVFDLMYLYSSCLSYVSMKIGSGNSQMTLNLGFCWVWGQEKEPVDRNQDV